MLSATPCTGLERGGSPERPQSPGSAGSHDKGPGDVDAPIPDLFIVRAIRVVGCPGVRILVGSDLVTSPFDNLSHLLVRECGIGGTDQRRQAGHLRRSCAVCRVLLRSPQTNDELWPHDNAATLEQGPLTKLAFDALDSILVFDKHKRVWPSIIFPVGEIDDAGNGKHAFPIAFDSSGQIHARTSFT